MSIGHAASHGCIRMFSRDIRELYSLVPHGTPVIVVGGCYGPFGAKFRILSPGDRGADVLAVQKKLKRLGYYKGYLSGIYSEELKSALHKFFRDNNVKIHDKIDKKDYNLMGFFEMD